MGTSTNKCTGPVLGFDSDTAADLLEHAASIIRFLQDVALAFEVNQESPGGLSPGGTNGLLLVLASVENTIHKTLKML